MGIDLEVFFAENPITVERTGKGDERWTAYDAYGRVLLKHARRGEAIRIARALLLRGAKLDDIVGRFMAGEITSQYRALSLVEKLWDVKDILHAKELFDEALKKAMP